MVVPVTLFIAYSCKESREGNERACNEDTRTELDAARSASLSNTHAPAVNTSLVHTCTGNNGSPDGSHPRCSRCRTNHLSPSCYYPMY